MSYWKSTDLSVLTRRDQVPPRVSAAVGKRFGKLVVLIYVGSKDTRTSSLHYFLTRCDCGREKVAALGNMEGGYATSCGCVHRRASVDANRKYEEKDVQNTPEYHSWGGMIQRCTNPKSAKYPRYGARGISVFPPWRESFAQFLKDMGKKPAPRYSLDRINNDGNYEPDNCRWATPEQQIVNTSVVRLIPFRGEVLSVSEAERRLGFNGDLLGRRLRAGWPLEKALTTPPRAWPKRKEEAQ